MTGDKPPTTHTRHSGSRSTPSATAAAEQALSRLADLARTAWQSQARLAKESVDVSRATLAGDVDRTSAGKAYVAAVSREGARFWRAAGELAFDYASDLMALGNRLSTTVLRETAAAGRKPGQRARNRCHRGLHAGDQPTREVPGRWRAAHVFTDQQCPFAGGARAGHRRTAGQGGPSWVGRRAGGRNDHGRQPAPPPASDPAQRWRPRGLCGCCRSGCSWRLADKGHRAERGGSVGLPRGRPGRCLVFGRRAVLLHRRGQRRRRGHDRGDPRRRRVTRLRTARAPRLTASADCCGAVQPGMVHAQSGSHRTTRTVPRFVAEPPAPSLGLQQNDPHRP